MKTRAGIVIYLKSDRGQLDSCFSPGDWLVQPDYLAWRFGGLMQGMAVDTLGTALGMSLVVLIACVFGSLGPMLLVQPAALARERGYTLMAGLAAMVLGIGICGTAGKQRENEIQHSPQAIPTLLSPLEVESPSFTG